MKISIGNIQDVFRSKKASVETMELKGYKLVKNLFVDNSGFGASNEPALTKSQFIIELEQILKQHQTVYTTITDEGQFQIYLGVFLRRGKPTNVKKIAKNTLEIIKDNVRIIRYYDTNILTFKNNTITLNSGGWETSSTKRRINEHLPSDVYIFTKNYEWFINIKNKIMPFMDGMKIKS